MSFPHLCIYFRFKYIPPRKFKYGSWKGVYLRLFGIEKFRGKCSLEHFISNFHIFPYNVLQTCHFHIFVCISVSNIPPSWIQLWFMKRVYLRLFGIEKYRGKCFLEHFISNFHIFPYNALQTCHFHIYVYISVSNIYPLVNLNMVHEKGLFTSFWHREVPGKVFLRALYIKFSHFPI